MESVAMGSAAAPSTSNVSLALAAASVTAPKSREKPPPLRLLPLLPLLPLPLLPLLPLPLPLPLLPPSTAAAVATSGARCRVDGGTERAGTRDYGSKPFFSGGGTPPPPTLPAAAPTAKGRPSGTATGGRAEAHGAAMGT